MTHDEARSLLAFRAGLAPEREAALANHLAECPACRAIAEEYRRQDAFLRSLDLPEPATDLRPGIFARLDKPRSAWRRFVPLAGLVPLGALFILITILVHPPKPAATPLSSAPTYGPGAPKNGSLTIVTPSGSQQPARSKKAAGSYAGIGHSGQRPAQPRKDSAAPLTSFSHRPQGSALIVSGGLRLSITVNRLTYPRNALVPVTVRLQNVSGHEIAVGFWGYNCQTDLAWPEVMSKNGRVVYPPAYPAEPVPFCPAMASRRLHAGQVVRKNLLVILRGPIIRGVTRPSCGPLESCPRLELRTPPLRLRLRAEAPPRMILRTSPPISARLIPTWPDEKGPLHRFDDWDCGPQAADAGGYLVWRTAKGTRLQPGCANPATWRGVVGWLNHSVVTFSYRRKH